ncbi:hypothetical protein V1477_009905 [Vespula maculifrons]|uniref:Uncharacterized protein n=1 Tax=Vespula maculifrons TaxID=7453 RepID=A0ABD2CB39_VESMC
MQQPPRGGTWFLSGGSHEWGSWAWASVRVSVQHDRSCLDMSEADGVDGGAICKRGFIHLQRWCSRARLSPKLALTHSTYSRECFRNARVSIVTAVDSILGSGVCRESTIGRAQASAGLQMQQPPRGGTWVGITCDTSETLSVGWVPWDGPLGVGFCAGLLPSVPNNRAGFSYSGFARPVGPQTQQPPSGGTWVGSTCDRLKSIHDRSCLDMSEADGVDGGAICKRGFIHLQFAEKPESPEAEISDWLNGSHVFIVLPRKRLIVG